MRNETIFVSLLFQYRKLSHMVSNIEYLLW